MNLLFIVNPVAGKGSFLNSIQKIDNYCNQHHLQFKVEQTQYRGHGIELAKNAQSLGFDAVIAVGGDGTLLEVANGLINSSLPLGVIPTGTGNDFARCIGVPSSIEDALDFLTSHQGKWIDIGKLNDVFFINVASIGFDAEIVRDVRKIKKYIPGKASYYISVFIKFFTYRFKKIYVEIDGQKMDLKILLLAVANGSYYGGGMKVNPTGLLEDGYLDVIIITDLPRIKIPLLFWKFAKGTYQDLPYVKTFKARSVKVDSEEELPINADGDIIAQTPAVFCISPLALNIIKKSTLNFKEVLYGANQ